MEDKNLANDDNENLSFKEFIDISKWIFSIMFKVSPITFLALCFTNIYTELERLINSFIFALIIDKSIEVAQSSEQDFNLLLPYLIIIFAQRLISELVWNIDGYCRNRLRSISNYKINILMYSKLNSLGVETLEDPDVNNIIHRANDYIWEYSNFNDRVLRFFARIIGGISAGAILATFNPILIPLLLVLSIPKMLWEKKYLEKVWKLDKSTTESRRIAWDNAHELRHSTSLKEISVTNSFSFFDFKFQNFANFFLRKQKRIYDSWYIGSYLLSTVTKVIIFIAFIDLFKSFLGAEITVGILTYRMAVIDNYFSSMFWGIFQIFDMRQYAIKFKEGKSLFDMKPKSPDGTISYKIGSLPPSIELNNVDFSYPNTDKKVIENLSLKIKNGEKIAIVGKNGAGKTTLAKLISRFYRPIEGQILIDGQNLNDFTQESWHKNIGVLFQDYNTYGQLTLKDNVFAGDPTKDFDEKAFKKAIKSADAEEFVEKFENKYDQILSERYKGGIRPSTGQWQKIAIARFFYRNAPLVIFDEPTAAIDAESEYNIFNEIYDFFENKTVIIISHRFSTVRNADRIIVFDAGKILEEGSHDELIKKNGQYAKMFKLQAEGYK
jgi:ATP-binding cassette subfamily B protein